MDNNFLHFFGTTGNKKMIYSATRSPGGLYINFENTKIIFDPGPGTFLNFVRSYPDQIYSLDAIILSHIHFDHSNDFNVFIEGMTKGGKLKRGTVIAPENAYKGKSKIIHHYLKDYPQQLLTSAAKKEFRIGNLSIETSVKHKHGIENYGFVFKGNNVKFSYITDTAYFDKLTTSYLNSDVLIINSPVYKMVNKDNPVHLDSEDIIKIINKINPGKVLLTHFGACYLKIDPETVADEITEMTGVKTEAVKDNSVCII